MSEPHSPRMPCGTETKLRVLTDRRMVSLLLLLGFTLQAWGAALPPVTALTASSPFDHEATQSAEFFEQLVPGGVKGRPAVSGGGPLKVRFGLEFTEIREVDAAARRFFARGYIWLYWYDPTLKPRWDAVRVVPNRADETWSVKFDAEEIRSKNLAWDPNIFFLNGENEITLKEQTYEIFPASDPSLKSHFASEEDAFVEEAGMACFEYHTAFSGWFSDRRNRLDFRLFPFDSQSFEVEIDCVYPANEVLFILDESTSPEDRQEMVDQLRHPEWKFDEQDYEFDLKNYSSELGRSYSIGRATLTAHRRSFYQITNLGIPIIIIMTIFNLCLWIRNEHFEAKIGGIVTCLLSLIAFGLIVAAELPEVPYLTLLGWFINACYLLIVVGTAVAIIEQSGPPPELGFGRAFRNRIRTVVDQHGERTIHLASVMLLILFLGCWIVL